MSEIATLVEQFATRLSVMIEAQVLERARGAVTAALGGPAHLPGRRGRPPKALKLTMAGRQRKKPPRQLCPVPGCKNPAAPVFGMVCAKHKDLSKTKIKKYREARRAKKLKAAAS